MDFLEDLTKAISHSDEKKASLHGAMEVLMGQWNDVESHLTVAKYCLTDCFNVLETREAGLTSLIQRNSEDFEAKRAKLDRDFKRLEEKEKLMKEVFKEIDIEAKVRLVKDAMNEKLKDISSEEQDIAESFGLLTGPLQIKEDEPRSKEEELKKWETILRSKERALMGKEKDLKRRESKLKSAKEELERIKSELDNKMISWNKREIELNSNEQMSDGMDKKLSYVQQAVGRIKASDSDKTEGAEQTCAGDKMRKVTRVYERRHKNGV